MRAALRWTVERLQFALFLLVELLVRSIPGSAVPAVSEALGTGWFLVDRRRRRRAAENLRVAFGPSQDPRERRRLVRAAFVSLVRVPLEVLLQPRLLGRYRDFKRRVALHGDWQEMWDRARRGEGGLLVGGHLGNWELGPRCLRLCGVNARAVMRPVDNRLINRHAIAARGGPETVIPKRGAVRAVMSTLRSGGWVGLLADQNAGRGGVFAPFFGLPASTHPLPAVLALRLRLPIYAGACLRRAGSEYAFDIHIRRIDVGPPGDDVTDERVDAVVARITAAIEAEVRAAPAQYNWVHRRWKSRPPGEAAGPHQPSYSVPYGSPGWAGSGGFRRRIKA